MTVAAVAAVEPPATVETPAPLAQAVAVVPTSRSSWSARCMAAAISVTVIIPEAAAPSGCDRPAEGASAISSSATTSARAVSRSNSSRWRCSSRSSALRAPRACVRAARRIVTARSSRAWLRASVSRACSAHSSHDCAATISAPLSVSSRASRVAARAAAIRWSARCSSRVLALRQSSASESSCAATSSPCLRTVRTRSSPKRKGFVLVTPGSSTGPPFDRGAWTDIRRSPVSRR